MSRQKLSKDARTVAALLAVKRGSEWLIPEPLRSTGSTQEILAAIDWHHNVPHALTQDDRPQNIVPMLKADHAEETAKRTIPMVAKSKRISRKEAEFRERMLAKATPDCDVGKTPQAPKAKMRSRPFQQPPEGTRVDWKTGRRVRAD